MKVLVISDTHGHTEDIMKVIGLHHNMDLYLHCGDSCTYNISPFSAVKGNCDFLLEYPNFKNIETPYGILHMEHGVRGNSEEYVKSCNCKIFLSGHTHRREALKYNDIYVFNPGSLSRPRDGHKSYLILDINSDGVDYKFYDLK